VLAVEVAVVHLATDGDVSVADRSACNSRPRRRQLVDRCVGRRSCRGASDIRPGLVLQIVAHALIKPRLNPRVGAMVTGIPDPTGRRRKKKEKERWKTTAKTYPPIRRTVLVEGSSSFHNCTYCDFSSSLMCTTSMSSDKGNATRCSPLVTCVFF
jgi:hypothetical protein